MLKVSPNHHKVIKQIVREVTRRREFCSKDDFYIPNSAMMTILRKVAKKSGYKSVKVDSGAFRAALILRNVVIKFPMETESRERMDDEIKFIERARKNRTFRRHIVETKAIRTEMGLVFVQERVNTEHPLPYFRLEAGVQALAKRMGIGDVHCRNYGWKGPKGKRYPVFFDLEFSHNPEKSDRKPTKLEKEFMDRSWQFGAGLDIDREESWNSVDDCHCTDCRHNRGDWTSDPF